jgi:hypothetical protein
MQEKCAETQRIFLDEARRKFGTVHDAHAAAQYSSVFGAAIVRELNLESGMVRKRGGKCFQRQSAVSRCAIEDGGAP